MKEWKSDNLGPESRKAHPRRVREGFFDKYFGGIVLDIGYRGYEETDVVPVLPDAIGVDLNYPGYDGKRLPFADASVDTVYASHTLEHIQDPHEAVREWFRVLKPGGYLVLAVPHQFLYEKRAALPSRWNGDHRRFYTPAALLAEVERSLEPNSYRVRRLADDDEDFDYSIPPERHSGGAYQIELVLQKIRRPDWELEGAAEARRREAVLALAARAREAAGSALAASRGAPGAAVGAFACLLESVNGLLEAAHMPGGGCGRGMDLLLEAAAGLREAASDCGRCRGENEAAALLRWRAPALVGKLEAALAECGRAG